eukprot:4890436-Alexandrium_andersonii.AAC.1
MPSISRQARVSSWLPRGAFNVLAEVSSVSLGFLRSIPLLHVLKTVKFHQTHPLVSAPNMRFVHRSGGCGLLFARHTAKCKISEHGMRSR